MSKLLRRLVCFYGIGKIIKKSKLTGEGELTCTFRLESDSASFPPKEVLLFVSLDFLAPSAESATSSQMLVHKAGKQHSEQGESG